MVFSRESWFALIICLFAYLILFKLTKPNRYDLKIKTRPGGDTD